MFLLYSLEAALCFILMIGLHELGHFLVARWCKVPISVFAVGLWPFMLRRRIGQTEWRLGLLPLGGFIKPDSDAIRSKRGWQRMLIYGAGPFVSIVGGLLVLSIVQVSCLKFYRYSDMEIAAVRRGSVADRAGLRPDDRIVAVNGDASKDWYLVLGTIEDTVWGYDRPLQDESKRFIRTADGKLKTEKIPPADRLSMTIERDHVRRELDLTPYLPEVRLERPFTFTKFGAVPAGPEADTMQIPPQMASSVRLHRLEAVWKLYIVSYWLTQDPNVGALTSPTQIGGNVGPFMSLYFSAKVGICYLLTAACAFSVVLGIFNLVPIPPLDGGKIAWEIGAWIGGLLRRRKPSDPVRSDAPSKAQIAEFAVSLCGAGLMLVLLCVAVVADVRTVLTWRW